MNYNTPNFLKRLQQPSEEEKATERAAKASSKDGPTDEAPQVVEVGAGISETELAKFLGKDAPAAKIVDIEPVEILDKETEKEVARPGSKIVSVGSKPPRKRPAKTEATEDKPKSKKKAKKNTTLLSFEDDE